MVKKKWVCGRGRWAVEKEELRRLARGDVEFGIKFRSPTSDFVLAHRDSFKIVEVSEIWEIIK